MTGGGTGIGLAIAQALANAGARVIIAGRRADVLDAALPHINGAAQAHALDLADLASLPARFAELTARVGTIDILVNNAGNTIKKPFEDSEMEDFDAVMDVYVRGAVELTRHFVRQAFGSTPASVVFSSSMTADIGQPLVLGYTTAKAVISGLVRGFSAELAGRNIRVNGVAPGWIDTALYRKATAGDVPRQQETLSRIPMARLGLAEEVGNTVAFLASPGASYITGQIVFVDGGGATGF
ncbi:gluconate 5-dehydrogenase [Aliiruegeria haliotis]|uniref:Gluconate 5-dehydrogenase n=1 Tax=Aliiruegeria haliotis TaxID=1280846 RepID=A0A2T0RMQ9_9RHOB|nr:gluconate 5-dehydrogenase [Aliiruegeria haliotis]